MNKSQVRKTREEIATIDVSLVTIETSEGEYGFDTANQIQVEPQLVEEEAVKLVIKRRLRAQKPKEVTVTGNKITLSDNVFNPDLVLSVQGGKLIYDTENPEDLIGYDPPASDSGEKAEVFKLNAYSSQYDESGQIVKYEKISYPNCQGSPIAFGSEDGVFRVSEYVIDSAPGKGEPPYRITYVKELPILVDQYVIQELDAAMTSSGDGTSQIVVAEPKANPFNKYMIKIGATTEAPKYGEKVTSSFSILEQSFADPTDDVLLVEVTSDDKIIAYKIFNKTV